MRCRGFDETDFEDDIPEVGVFEFERCKRYFLFIRCSMEALQRMSRAQVGICEQFDRRSALRFALSGTSRDLGSIITREMESGCMHSRGYVRVRDGI